DIFGRAGRRGTLPGLSGPFYPYTLRNWKRRVDRIPPPPGPKALLSDRIAWMMGEPPPSASVEVSPDTGEPYHQAVMLRRGGAPEGLERHTVGFGQYLYATVFAPQGTAASEGKLAGVLWLHPHSVPAGTMAAYLRGEQAPYVFAKAGLVVFCYDHIGFGSRIIEGSEFYDRYPDWSLFGKMLSDASGAFEALRSLPYVDPDKIFLAGYGLGGMLAIHMAALDGRPAGVASCCGFEPFSTDPSRSGGIARFCEWDGIGLLPRLARFVGRESKVPYDFDELLRAIAPRPVLIISPKYDRENDSASVCECVARVRDAFGPWALKHLTPDDYNRLSPKRKEEIASWLRDAAGIGRA
ncbi:MAG: acetylxylan esterase, partial [Planctomycetota bacterium]|nr:acetylxylan esterase [Planctomycetota bacterium]